MPMKIVVIKDREHHELPHGCSNCFYREFNWCELENRTVLGRVINNGDKDDFSKAVVELEQINERPTWCPLIEIDLPEQSE